MKSPATLSPKKKKGEQEVGHEKFVQGVFDQGG
jgi:hypothetical protein